MLPERTDSLDAVPTPKPTPPTNALARFGEKLFQVSDSLSRLIARMYVKTLYPAVRWHIVIPRVRHTLQYHHFCGAPP